MMYTREQMVEAYLKGAIEFGAEYSQASFAEAISASEGYVDSLKDAPRIAPEDITIDQCRSGHLPPNGTGEEFLARCLTSLMCRTAIMFQDQPGAEALFSTDWLEAQLDALRNAFPILGTLEAV